MIYTPDTLTLHFEAPVTIGEVQLAAKVVKAILTDDPYHNNLHLINCPIPIEIEGDWCNLEAYASQLGNNEFFYFENPHWGRIRYQLERNTQITNIEVNLFLETVQRTMEKICKGTAIFDIHDADSLIVAFISINTSISSYFHNEACAQNRFCWNEKYSPCFFDRKRFSDFRSQMMPEYNLDLDTQKLLLCKKYVTRDFLMQTKFLTFWVSLLDVATFPGLCDTHKKIYSTLVKYFLKNYANIYIYDIVIEAKPIIGLDISSRGSECNTTRLKIYFTENDDIPQILRLDLPHIDHPYVHINKEKYGSTILKDHIRLSDNIHDEQYDCLFEPLIETLRYYNFYTISTRHSPADDDKSIIREMKYLTAMYNYAIVVRAYLYLGDKSHIIKTAYANQNKDILLKLLQEDGIASNNIEDLNPYDFFEFADMAIQANHIIP